MSHTTGRTHPPACNSSGLSLMRRMLEHQDKPPPWKFHEPAQHPAFLLCLPGRDRSRTRRRDRERVQPPTGWDRADRVRKHCFRRRAGSPRVGADQQIRRGLSRPPLLRRLRLCRYRGDPGNRAGQAAFWLRLRECAAAFRRAGQPGRLPGAGQAGRHHPGHEPGRRRPSDPRRRAKFVRQVVQRDPVRRPQGGRHPGL